jgi:S-adenosylmethionine:tRNA ribosyltransferase-isomerase
MTGLRVEDFNFDLPPELIAQQPPAERGTSRMLVVNRSTGVLRDANFIDLPSLLNPGDLLVLNDSRVIPARLYARRIRKLGAPGLDSETWETAFKGQIEVLLTEPLSQQELATPDCHPERAQRVEGRASSLAGAPGPDSGTWETTDLNPPPTGENLWRALVKPGKKVSVGERLVFPSPSGSIELEADVLERGEFGERLLRFHPVDDFFSIIERIGHMPLPPYIRRDDSTTDRDRYQTVYSSERGSVAAPTAGLHFTPQVLDALAAKGVEIAHITLHVGLGTFAPLRVARLEDIRLHREHYTLNAEAADALNRAVSSARRIVAVGTTVVRTLEHCALQAAAGQLQPHSGSTEIFISPGFNFRLVGALLTNFHLPKSSLLMLVSAFAGREPVLAAYRHSVQQQYRFFSYGDCMFIA